MPGGSRLGLRSTPKPPIEIGDWLAEAADDDTLGQHFTQRQAIESNLTGAVAELKTKLTQIAGPPTGAIDERYDDCRQLEQLLVLRRQLWEFYGEKLDQPRDAVRLAPLLRAADELVWSTRRTAMERASMI